jgi:outer membrane murein-binding lipoprotein Lpp
MVLALSFVLMGCGPKALAGQVYKLEQQMDKIEDQAFAAGNEKQLEKLRVQYEKLEAQRAKLEEKYDAMSEKDQGIYVNEYDRLREYGK